MRRVRLTAHEVGLALISGSAGALCHVPLVAALIAVAGILLVTLAPKGRYL